MKKSLHFALVMAMGMMAMSPATAWAEDAFSVTIGGTTTNYEDVTAAFEAASAGTAATPATVTMLADYDKMIYGQYYLKLTSGVMTFDLNGHELKPNGNQSAISVQGADLTIVDNSASRTGYVGGDRVTAAIDYQTGKLTVHGGTFCGYSTTLALNCWGGAALTPGGVVLRGGTFINNYSCIGVDNSTDGWNTLDMDGYKFINLDTEEDVAIPVGKESSIHVSVKVVPEVSTGISDLNVMSTSKAVKTFENGQLVITKDGKRYNAAGQMMK